MPFNLQRWSPLLLVAACGPAVESNDSDPTPNSGSSSESDSGDRPSAPRAMYSACETVSDCAPLAYCVFPPGESGFCSAACVSQVDSSSCDPSPGGDAGVGCLDLSMPDGNLVCALNCGDGICPGGMRCERVDTYQGAQSICF